MFEHIDINSICFLCKRDTDITEEHVFPRWMQQDYNLQNQFITLKNGTRFRYKNIKVPCCKSCNTQHMSKIESNISKAVRCSDIDYLLAYNNQTFIWLYKIMYGLNYKEMFLKDDIKDTSSKSIVCKNEFFKKHSYNLFPLYAIGEIDFVGFRPYSLFVFKLSEVIDGGYFYADEPYKMFSLIVLGDVGMVCSFQCDGYIEQAINDKLKVDHRNNFSAAEFGDFSAFVLHLKMRMTMLPNYLCHNENGRVIFKIQDSEDGGMFRPFDVVKQSEITFKMCRPLFQKLIKWQDGQQQIQYKSPFVYF